MYHMKVHNLFLGQELVVIRIPNKFIRLHGEKKTAEKKIKLFCGCAIRKIRDLFVNLIAAGQRIYVRDEIK